MFAVCCYVYSFLRVQRRANCGLIAALMWISGLWAASVVVPPCPPLSTRTRIRYEVQHIPSLTVVWVAASSLPSCPCEQIQTVFWCCLLCCGKTTRLINLTRQKSHTSPHGGQAELFLHRWSKGISTWASAVVNKKELWSGFQIVFYTFVF